MLVKPIKTQIIKPNTLSIYEVIDKFVEKINERNILVISSKLVAVCEGRIVKKVSRKQKEKLIKQEADWYIEKEKKEEQNFFLTIKNNIIIPSAGIDESNSFGYYILWPQEPQKSANDIRNYLKNRFNLTHVGVLIIDSKTSPIRAGVTGVALAHSGFISPRNYIGNKDLCGEKLKFTTQNVRDSLASAANLVMGEGSEAIPMALIKDVDMIDFKIQNPSKKELKKNFIDKDIDIYSPLLNSINWKKKD